AVSLGYNICLGVIGGLTPLVATWLVERTGDEIAPAYLIMASAAVTAVALTCFCETYPAPFAGGTSKAGPTYTLWGDPPEVLQAVERALEAPRHAGWQHLALSRLALSRANRGIGRFHDFVNSSQRECLDGRWQCRRLYGRCRSLSPHPPR